MVDFAKWFPKLCPPKPADTCPADLLKCNEEKAALQGQLATETAACIKAMEERDNFKGLLTNCNTNVAALQKQYDEVLALSKLLTEGPAIPDMSKARWCSSFFIDQVMARQLGTKYTGCIHHHFSEDDYLVCSVEEMKRFIAYYATFWMPHIKYVTQTWKKLNGSQVEIWMNDCDDFTNFFMGINALNANWACFPWGKIWAEVKGLMLAGGHAFNCIICCDSTYNETGIDGLKAYLLEPQMAGGGPWPAARPEIVSYELKEIEEVSGFFEIVGTIWMFEV